MHTALQILTICWSSGNAFVSGVGGLWFKSRVRQIGHSVANGSPPPRHFFESSSVAVAVFESAMTRKWASPIHFTLQRIIASITKDLI